LDAVLPDWEQRIRKGTYVPNSGQGDLVPLDDVARVRPSAIESSSVSGKTRDAGGCCVTQSAARATPVTPAQRERYDRVVAAAEVLFAGGEEAVQMKDLAQRAGLSLATLYRYFPRLRITCSSQSP
jgi:hypothetical protein